MGAKNSTPNEDHEEIKQKIQMNGGTPLEPGNMEMEPWASRGCTDILFLLLFILFVAGMIVVGIFGFVQGNPIRLQYGYDFNGNVCGHGKTQDRTKLYYPYPFPPIDSSGQFGSSTDVDLTWAVCVKTCPNQITEVPPNQCMMPFKTVSQSGGIIDCGDLVEGKTLMAQFTPLAQLKKAVTGLNTISSTNTSVSAGDTVVYGLDPFQGPLGYQAYCMDRVPKCSPCDDESCCDGTNQIPLQTRRLSDTPTVNPTQNLFGVPLGRKYGFCYVPIPTSSASFTTRCIPSAGSDLNAAALTKGLSTFTNSSSTTPVTSSDLSAALSSVANALGSPQEAFNSLCNEIQKNKWVIVGSAGIALAVALLYTQILRVAAGFLTFTVLGALWLVLAGSTVVLSCKAGFIDKSQIPLQVDGVTSTVPLPAGVTLGNAATNQQLVIIAAVLVGVVFLIYTLLLCVMVTRIYLAIKVIKQAAACLSEIPSALLFPILQWLALSALFVWFVIVFLYLASAGEWNQTTHRFTWNDNTRRAIIYHCFGLLWIRAWILAVGNLVIAGATCDWFIVHDKSMLSFPVYSSLMRSLRFHMGTAAFGSLIITIVQFIRWVFRYYMYQLAKLDKNNSIIKFLNCIGECCLACVERFLKFINRNAYIQTAMKGTNFCSSAKTATMLLIRNCLRVGALAALTTIFNNIGKLFIAVVTGLICALIIQGGDMASVNEAPIFSITIIVILAFGIASAFIDVWDVVVESLFQCFCIDIEKGSGKTPGQFKQFLAENEGKGATTKEISSQI